MEYDLLLKEILDIQQDYRSLLIAIQSQFDSSEKLIQIADEITIFWYSRRNIIDLFLKNLPNDNSTYLFTGVGYLDVENNEHYPFVTIGKRHIIDDSLSRYMQDIKYDDESGFYFELIKQIQEAITDNIRILNEYFGIFLLLPVRFFVPNHIDILHQATSDLFLSLFNSSLENIDDYFSKYDCINQVFDDINAEIKSEIKLLEDDSSLDSLEDKFEQYKKENKTISEEKNDITLFFLAVYGYIAQALDVILTSLEYNLVPYVRFKICHHYSLLLTPTLISDIEENLKERFEYKIMMMTAVHVLYHCFNFSKIENCSFQEYISVVQSLDISNNYTCMVLDNFASKNEQKRYINEIAKEELERIYAAIGEPSN